MKFKIIISGSEKDIEFAHIKLSNNDNYESNLNYVKAIVQVLIQEHEKNPQQSIKDFNVDTDMIQIQDESKMQYFYNHHDLTWILPD